LVGEWEQELATEWDKKVYVNGRSWLTQNCGPNSNKV
jgi:hypothetical protein